MLYNSALVLYNQNNMTKIRVAINGFGRIGRLTTRVLLSKYADEIEIVAINDLTNVANLAYLLKHDSVYPAPDFKVETKDENLILNNITIPILNIKDPVELPWKSLSVDVVLECTGVFVDEEGIGKHLKAGAKSVILSSPCKTDGVPTVVCGVNEIPKGLKLYSNASCTTNCVAPVLKCLDDNFVITRGSGVTVHAYTATQTLQDSPTKGLDFRKSRAAAINIIPSSSGAAKAITQVLPRLKNKLTFSAVRVPVITGSMVQFVLEFERPATLESVIDSLQKYAYNHPDILEVSREQLVSSDIIGNPHSAIIDTELCKYQQK